MAHYVIGDIHGCLTSLLRLLDKIHFSTEEDILWFTGDLVNRGADSLGTLHFIKQLKQAVVVLGNHDLYLLAQAFAKTGRPTPEGFQAILQAPDRDELCHWLRQQSLLYHDAILGYTLVHAGLPPQWNLTKAIACAREVETVLRGKFYIEFLQRLTNKGPIIWQETLQGWDRWQLITHYLTRLRFCDCQGRLDLTTVGKAPRATSYLPWFKVPHRASRGLRLIFGHWSALRGETGEEGVYALDTGCVWGDYLTAMRLEDGRRFSVACTSRA